MILITIPPTETYNTISISVGISGSINLWINSVTKKKAVDNKNDALKKAPNISNLL